MRRRSVRDIHACTWVKSDLGSNGGGSCFLGSTVGAVGRNSSLAFGGVLGTILLARAVNGDLDGDLAALDLLAVHFSNGLVLLGGRSECDEAETATLASLAASLKLLDHEAGDRSERNLSGDGFVGSKKFLELRYVSAININ